MCEENWKFLFFSSSSFLFLDNIAPKGRGSKKGKGSADMLKACTVFTVNETKKKGLSIFYIAFDNVLDESELQGW